MTKLYFFIKDSEISQEERTKILRNFFKYIISIFKIKRIYSLNTSYSKLRKSYRRIALSNIFLVSDFSYKNEDFIDDILSIIDEDYSYEYIIENYEIISSNSRINSINKIDDQKFSENYSLITNKKICYNHEDLLNFLMLKTTNIIILNLGIIEKFILKTDYNTIKNWKIFISHILKKKCIEFSLNFFKEKIFKNIFKDFYGDYDVSSRNNYLILDSINNDNRINVIYQELYKNVKILENFNILKNANRYWWKNIIFYDFRGRIYSWSFFSQYNDKIIRNCLFFDDKRDILTFMKKYPNMKLKILEYGVKEDFIEIISPIIMNAEKKLNILIYKLKNYKEEYVELTEEENNIFCLYNLYSNTNRNKFVEKYIKNKESYYIELDSQFSAIWHFFGVFSLKKDYIEKTKVAYPSGNEKDLYLFFWDEIFKENEIYIEFKKIYGENFFNRKLKKKLLMKLCYSCSWLTWKEDILDSMDLKKCSEEENYLSRMSFVEKQLKVYGIEIEILKKKINDIENPESNEIKEDYRLKMDFFIKSTESYLRELIALEQKIDYLKINNSIKIRKIYSLIFKLYKICKDGIWNFFDHSMEKINWDFLQNRDCIDGFKINFKYQKIKEEKFFIKKRSNDKFVRFLKKNFLEDLELQNIKNGIKREIEYISEYNLKKDERLKILEYFNMEYKKEKRYKNIFGDLNTEDYDSIDFMEYERKFLDDDLDYKDEISLKNDLDVLKIPKINLTKDKIKRINQKQKEVEEYNLEKDLFLKKIGMSELKYRCKKINYSFANKIRIEEVDIRKTKRSFLANLIQSYDAELIRRMYYIEKDLNFLTIHDAIKCDCYYIDVFIYIYNTSYIETHYNEKNSLWLKENLGIEKRNYLEIEKNLRSVSY